MSWQPAYVAVGSNLDDPAARVCEALAALGQLPGTRRVAQSRLWRGPPLGPQDQPAFVNAVAALLTTLEPEALLAQLQALERRLGKVPPPVRWGPRRIDLDLLLHSTAVRDVPGLKLPHPGLPTRNFVLYPLAELAPSLWIPGHGRVQQLAQQVDAAGLQPLDGAA